MDVWAWTFLVVAVAAIFMVVSGEVVVTFILTGLWVGVIWLLVTYGGVVMDGPGPAIVIVVGMVILSIVTLAAMASAIEDRRSDKT
ncbi:hypothetical protein ABN034_16065 [Actinopolymorpha sp. B11F2]|uniref:hypothetical protein n=1 Tax=Actinopolymorpha sp. B11F2 TaxID=3160862 RepID=UPI0032E426F9